MSPPRKSIQAINQDKPAAHRNCSLLVIQSRGGIIMAPYTDFSPHLTSPEGEGRIPLATLFCQQLSDYQWFINSNRSCPSPTGEARWGLESRCRVTCSFPLGRSGWVILRGGQVGADGSIQSSQYWLRKRECYKHSRIHENPDNNPITICQLKNQ